MGTIDAHKLEPGAFSVEDLEIFEDLATLSAIVLKKQKLQKRLDTMRRIADYYSNIQNINLPNILSEFLKKV